MTVHTSPFGVAAACSLLLLLLLLLENHDQHLLPPVVEAATTTTTTTTTTQRWHQHPSQRRLSSLSKRNLSLLSSSSQLDHRLELLTTMIQQLPRGGGSSSSSGGSRGAGSATRAASPKQASSSSLTSSTSSTSLLQQQGAVVQKDVSNNNDSNQSNSKASIPSSIFNLVNNVAGAGILTLSAGMANSGTGWIPSCLICAVLGYLSAHTFVLIGDACDITGERDFKGLWARTIGKKSTFVVDAIVSIMCLAVAVIYSGILGDVFTPLLEQAGITSAVSNVLVLSRTTNIVLITLTLLLPMSLIKNMSALAFTSILGFTAIMYTVLFIVVRAIDGSYGTAAAATTAAASSSFLLDGLLPFPPSFEKSSLWKFDLSSLVLASNLGLAYIAHYNGPTFYRELKDTNPNRFRIVVGIAFVILVALYIATMTAGYSTFGDVCQGNILLNYHPHDILATLGRLATGFSILFGFPLVACGAREGIAGAAASLGYPHIGEDRHFVALVVAILLVVTTISCTIPDVSLVVGLTGAAMGSFIVYICPAIIYTRAVQCIKGKDSPEYHTAKYNLALVPFGILIGALGVYMTIKEAL